MRHCVPLAAAATAALDARFEAFRRDSLTSAGGGSGGVGSAAKLRSPVVPRATAGAGGKRARATVAAAAAAGGGVGSPSFEAFLFTPRAKK